MLVLAPTRSRLPCRASSARACMSSKAVACGMKASARVVGWQPLRLRCTSVTPTCSSSFCKCCDTVGWASQRPRRALKTACLNDRYQALQPDRIQHAAGSALGRRFAALIGRAPANTWMMFCAAQRSISGRTAPHCRPYVRSEQRIRMREQRRIDQPRPVRASPVFHFEYIRRIPAELASLKRREHGGFIHYRTTTGVYKQNARPYEGKQLGVDQMLGIGIQRKRQQDEVELAKSSLHATGAGRAVARFVYQSLRLVVLQGRAPSCKRSAMASPMAPMPRCRP